MSGALVTTITPLLAVTSESAEQLSFWSYLLDVLVLLAAATCIGVLFERLRQSAIVGFLLAGTLLGPHALNLVNHEQGVQTIAELGVALLLFSIGLEFSVGRLRELGARALLGGTLQVTVTMAVAACIGWAAGLTPGAATAVGAMLAMSSTAVVLRTLADRGEVDSVQGRASLGVLLLQDVAVIPLVLLLDALGGEGTAGQVALGAARQFALAAAMVAAFWVLFRFGMPLLVQSQVLSRNREFPILLAIITAIGSAWTAYALGLSPALGAFVAGVLLGESPVATQVRADVGPLRTLFVTLFFGAIGMLADVGWMVDHWALVLGVFVMSLVGKAAIIWLIMHTLGLSHRASIATGLCLAQIGEFSFVLAGIASASELIDADTFALVVSVTLPTLLVTPYLVAYSPDIGAGVERVLRRIGLAATPREEARLEEHEPLRGHVVIVGYGPAGRAVADAVRSVHTDDDGADVDDGRHRAVIIDLNPQSVLDARAHGIEAYVGDATMPEILEHTHANRARAVVVTLPDHRTTADVIRQVRAVCPNIPIIARSRYHYYVDELRRAGSHVVIDEEESVGERLGAAVQETL